MQRKIDKLKRKIFLESCNNAYENLKKNIPEWEKELSERELWDKTIDDGLDILDL